MSWTVIDSPVGVLRLVEQDGALTKIEFSPFALEGQSRDGQPRGARDDVRRSLLELPGIGPWTADYVAMRALGHPDVFLPTDIGVRNAVAGLGHDPAAVIGDSERWRPWRSYALMHLWNTLMPPIPHTDHKED